MAIEQKRIEAAARAMMVDPKLWDISTESYRDEWRGRALDVLAASFPELASDPPTGWVAPWDATEAMEDVADAVALDRERRGFAPNGAGKWLFIAMRDAYTKEQT